MVRDGIFQAHAERQLVLAATRRLHEAGMTVAAVLAHVDDVAVEVPETTANVV